MGVYIKGMEMPTSCRACLYSRTDIRNVDWCVLTEKDLPCDCPLVPVPPHGRLIDADALEALFWDGQCYFTENIKYKIKNIETIFPAEEGE